MIGELTGRKVFFIFLAFFAVIIGANVVMMTYAARTFDGVQENDAYRKGRDFNDVLAASKAQEALGWQVDISATASGSDALNRALSVRFSDRQAMPLDDLMVQAQFFSPVEEEEDQSTALVHWMDGEYRGNLRLPRAGRWQLRIIAEMPDGRIFRQYKDLYFKP